MRISWRKKFIKVRNGVPFYDSKRRVFRMIRPDAFQEAFLAWLFGLEFGSDGLNVVAIEGISLRHSLDKKTFKGMLHSVAAWSVAKCVVLRCKSVDRKSNEITAISEMLQKLELKGAIITMDAMGSQKDIAAQIVEGGGNYVLAIKDNHLALAKAIREYFDDAQEERLIEHRVRNQHTSDAKHGRLENRYYYQVPIPDSMRELADSWKESKSIGQVHNITMRDGKKRCAIRYYLSSMSVGVKRFASAVRAHRSIENPFQ